MVREENSSVQFGGRSPLTHRWTTSIFNLKLNLSEQRKVQIYKYSLIKKISIFKIITIDFLKL